MQKVFTHENRLIVFHVKNLLEGEGIACQVKNEFSSGGVGDLSPFETWPEIWIEDQDLAQAELIIKKQSLNDPGPGLTWRCAQCGEKNAGNFKICWNCNHSQPS